MMIPHILVERVREGKVVLFLGSGASKGALHPRGMVPPDGQQLADMIAKKFLGDEYVGKPLDHVTALAMSETDLVTVQDFVAGIFAEFRPADFHGLIPRFLWSAIATTNYDLIVERAYAETGNSGLQKLEPFVRNNQHVEDRLRDPSALMYLKLHGCVTELSNPDVPLILTPEQYITHRRGRSRLFEKLVGLAHEQSIVFVGYSLSDIDLRMILYELASLGDAIPRSYIVAPKITNADERYWSNRKMTCLKGTFKEFLEACSEALSATP
jgi:SIR2-like domain